MPEHDIEDQTAALNAIIDQQQARIARLEAEIERKNASLEDFLAENEALRAELGGKPRPRRATPPPVNETLDTKIARWKRQGR